MTYCFTCKNPILDFNIGDKLYWRPFFGETPESLPKHVYVEDKYRTDYLLDRTTLNNNFNLTLSNPMEITDKSSTSEIITEKFNERISSICDSIKTTLLEKNRRYGNSALSPLNVFSKQSSTSSIESRLDDKISRIKNSNEIRKNDVFDLIGYLTLYCISKNWTFEDLID